MPVCNPSYSMAFLVLAMIPVGEEQAMRHLEALFHECEQFAKDVEAGKV
jgi:hypothetical protein